MWTKLIQEHIMTTQLMKYFFRDCAYRRGCDMRLIRSGLYERQYKQMRKIFIPLCKKSPYKYNLNMLRIIVLIYHMYIEYELYNLAYNKNPGLIYEYQFIGAKMSKRDDFFTFTEIFIDRGILLCIILTKLMLNSFVNIYYNEHEFHMVIINVQLLLIDL